MRDRLRAAMGRVGEALRLDSWLNGTTNVGVNHGKNALTFHAQRSDYLHDEALARLYELDGIAARIVDAVPKHAMRRPPTLRIGDAATSIAVQDALDDLGAWGALRDAWCWSRLFGGAAVVLGADDGLDPREPLTLAGLSALRFLVAVDRRDLTPQTWEPDELSSRYGSPRTYLLQRHGGTTTQTAAVHRSRVIRFEGVPTTRRRRLELQGWGDSVLQRVHVELQAARGVFAGAGTLVQEASVTVVGVKDLMSLMGDDPDDVLKTRFDVMQRMMGLGRWLLIDAEGERAERLEVGALTGLVDVLDRFVNFLAAVSGIPVTVLMGQAPAGLNATGESDIRSWYDEVAAEREAVLRPALERLVRAILRAKDGPTKGVEPAGWRIDFPPLWQMTPAEEVELRAKQAGIDAQYVTAQVLTPEEVAINRFRADGWSPETSIDLAARKALLDEDDAGEDGRVDARGAEHAAGVAGVVARVAAREIPRATGVELLVQAFELDATAADRAMGEAGRTWFTAPEPTHAAELDAMRADLAKAQASLRGHQAYTARLIQRAKAGGLELGAFTAREPTEVGEGDVLEPGDVVAVPVQDGRATGQRVDAHTSGVAVVLELPSEAAAGLPTETPPKDLHVTLAFLDDAPEASDVQARLIETVRSWAQSVPQIAATLGGIGRFPAGPDGEPVYVPVDAPDLAARRSSLVSALQGAGFEASQAHGFTPHVTLAYLAPGAPTPDPVPPRAVTFARVAIWAGWWRWSCPLDPDRIDAGNDHWKEQGRDKGQFTSGPSRAGGPTSAKPPKEEERGPGEETTGSASVLGEGQGKRRGVPGQTITRLAAEHGIPAGELKAFAESRARPGEDEVARLAKEGGSDGLRLATTLSEQGMKTHKAVETAIAVASVPGGPERVEHLVALGRHHKDAARMTTDAHAAGLSTHLDAAMEDVRDGKATVAGPATGHEFIQAVEFAKNHGGGSLTFERAKQGVEGVHRDPSGVETYVSLKRLNVGKVGNLEHEVMDNEGKVRRFDAAESKKPENQRHPPLVGSSVLHASLNFPVKDVLAYIGPEGSAERKRFLHHVVPSPDRDLPCYKEMTIVCTDADIVVDSSGSIIQRKRSRL